MTRPALALLAVLALTSSPLAAQPTLVRLPAGARVRVTTPSRAGWVTGTLVDSEHVVLGGAPQSAPDTIALTAVQALEVSRGRPRATHAAGGLVLGAIGGGVLGFVGGSVAARGLDPADEGAITKALGVATGVAVGAVIGAVVGAVTAEERWGHAQTPAPYRTLSARTSAR